MKELVERIFGGFWAFWIGLGKLAEDMGSG